MTETVILTFNLSRVSPAVQDPDWRARESAVLALGAISEGCHRGLVPFMGPMVTMLTPKLSDERPLVRAPHWTLGLTPSLCPTRLVSRSLT